MHFRGTSPGNLFIYFETVYFYSKTCFEFAERHGNIHPLLGFQKETWSVHRQQAGRQVIPRKRRQPGKERKCLSLDGILDTPKPAHEAKSFSLDTDDPRKNRFVKRNILLRRDSSKSSGSFKAGTMGKVQTGESGGNTCPYCGKSFTSKAGMYYHLPIHTGRFKINCKTCGMGFMDTIKYRTHLRKQCQPCCSQNDSVNLAVPKDSNN